MSGTNRFVITNAGLTAASLASPLGPYVEIVAFKFGDDATTAPLATDHGLAGNTVYEGVPSSYSFYDATTVQINLEVPADVGPFDYGEVGIYLPNDVLFARFSYGALRTKQTALSAGFANVLRVKALIQLAQGPSVFNILPGQNQTVLELSTFLILNTPVDHIENPVIIVHEPNDFQESVLVFKEDSTLWSIANYSRIGTAQVTGSAGFNQITSSFFGTLYQPPTGSMGKYVIQATGGYLRTIINITGNVATLANSFNVAGLIGQNIAVYQLDTALLKELSNTTAQLQLTLSNLDLYMGLATLSGSLYTISTGGINPPPEVFSAKFNATNPANATLRVNGNGPFPLLDVYGAAAPAGLIQANETRTIVFTNNTCIVQDQIIEAFPDGTRLLFNQSTAPVGWVKDTQSYLDNSALRLVTGNVDFYDGDSFTYWHSESASSNYSAGSLVAPGALGSFGLKYNDVIVCEKSSSGSIPIKAFPPLPTISFTPANGQVAVGQSMDFVGSATNPPITSWLWNFGDGTTSTVQSPNKNYSNSGQYTVQLTATNAAGSRTVQRTNAITVTVPLPVPSMTFTTTGGNHFPVGTPINFIGGSTNPPIISWLWNFGDGTTSTVQSPNKSYATPGSYTVSLTATNASGNGTTTQPNFVVIDTPTYNEVVVFVPNPATAGVSGTWSISGGQPNDTFNYSFVGNTASSPQTGSGSLDGSGNFSQGAAHATAGSYTLTVNFNGTGNTRQFSGTVTAPASILNGSLALGDALNNYIQYSGHSDGGFIAWTWTSWIKIPTVMQLPPTIPLFYSKVGALTTVAPVGQEQEVVFTVSDGGGFNFYCEGRDGFVTVSVASSGTPFVFDEWVHVCLVYNSSQPTSTDRVKIYVNNVRAPLTTMTSVSQNVFCMFGSEYIGANDKGALTSIVNSNAQFADTYFLASFLASEQVPTQFISNATGTWKPIPFAPSMGANDYHLAYDPALDTNSVILDSSGNGRNFTGVGLVANSHSTDHP